SNLHRLLVGSEQQILRLDVTMDHAALVRVRKSGTNLLEVVKRSFDRQRVRLRKLKQIAAGKILEHDVMKRRAGEVDRRAVSQTIYHVGMTHAIKRHCLVLKICDERSLQLGVRCFLEIKIQSFDDDRAR